MAAKLAIARLLWIDAKCNGGEPDELVEVERGEVVLLSGFGVPMVSSRTVDGLVRRLSEVVDGASVSSESFLI